MSGNNLGMNIYKRHRFPPDIISYAVWLYHRFNLSHRDIEDLLAERGITVSHESIRLWCIKFGPKFARRLRRKHQGFGDTFYVDEVFVKIRGKQHYLWRAVDQGRGRRRRFSAGSKGCEGGQAVFPQTVGTSRNRIEADVFGDRPLLRGWDGRCRTRPAAQAVLKW